MEPTGKKRHRTRRDRGNGAFGESDPAAAGPRWVAASERSRGDASDIDGQAERSNGAFGKSDIEGKAAMGSGERAGKRTSFKWAGAHESISIRSTGEPRPLGAERR